MLGLATMLGEATTAVVVTKVGLGCLAGPVRGIGVTACSTFGMPFAGVSGLRPPGLWVLITRPCAFLTPVDARCAGCACGFAVRPCVWEGLTNVGALGRA